MSKYYSNNCFRQESSMNAKINEKKYGEKQDAYSLQLSPHKILLKNKGKNGNFTV